MMNTETRYFGKVCEKHLELGGERKKVNGTCLRCNNELKTIGRRNKRRSDPDYKEKLVARDAEYRQQNREKITAKARQRRVADPAYALKMRVRSRMKNAFRYLNLKKPAKTSAILGCDWAMFKQHFESLFVDGMSWDNRHLWHVDHIIPLASASTEQELIALCHYTNLQPLWAEDNMSKGCKILSIFNRSTPNERIPQL